MIREYENIGPRLYRVAFRDALDFMEYISGQGKVVSGFEGAWYYEDGAVQPLGDLISVIDDLLDASAVEDALRAPLEVPISEYEKQKNSGPAELKIEFSVVDQF